MDIKQYIKKALDNKEIIDLLPNKRTYFLKATDTKENPLKTPYLEYEILDEEGDEYSENQESYTRYVIQIDVFSKGDYTEIEKMVKKHMKLNGFNREMAGDMYEKETQLYHKAMRFSISLPTERMM